MVWLSSTQVLLLSISWALSLLLSAALGGYFVLSVVKHASRGQAPTVRQATPKEHKNGGRGRKITVA